MKAPEKVHGSAKDQCPTPTASELREREDRLEALKLLSGKLAHDYNNFLAPVLGYTALLKEEVPEESSAMSYASALEQSARRTGDLLEEVLIAARPKGRVHRRHRNFSELLNEEILQWRDGLQPTARITVTHELEEAEFLLDAKLWRIAIKHLLSNARLALATGGHLSISMKHRSLESDFSSELGLLHSEVIHLQFRDNGYGMSPEVLRHAFDPFFTTRPKTHGRGLGLTLIHTVVRAHGGQIVLSSTEEEGTTADLYIPVVTDTDGPSPSPAGSRGKDRRKKPAKTGGERQPTILVVDDDPWIIEVIHSCLKKSEYATLTAQDGAEGLKVFQAHAREIALVVSDVSMPNMNGIEMCRAIRNSKPEIPILFMSGAPEVLESASEFFQAGSPITELIKKPFALKDLLERVSGLADACSLESN